jgi:hypothetical protein
MAGNALQARLWRHGEVILAHLLANGRGRRIGFRGHFSGNAKNEDAHHVRKNDGDG